MVLKQVLRDIRKEWSWALFYTVVATMIVMAISFLYASFSSVRKQSSSIQSFIDQKVVMFQFMPTQMEPAEGGRQASESFDLMKYLQLNLSEEGNAGSYVIVGNDGYVDDKYESILILFGQYSSLAGLNYGSPMALFVPEAHKEDVGTQLTVAGQTIDVIDTVGSDFDLFHPLYYIDSENPILSNALVLCTRDFQTVNSMFPWWGLTSEVFGRMVLLNPTDAEVSYLQAMFYNQYGTIYKGISTEEFTKTTTIASMRAHRLYMWFYILSGVLLLIMLMCNVIRMVEAHVADYTVHHLYGAPVRLIQQRVGGFVFSLNILPIVGVLFILAVYELTLWYLLPLCMVLILALCVFAACYAGKRIGTLNSLGNLRRDY